jgi:anti-anti-sigma factor
MPIMGVEADRKQNGSGVGFSIRVAERQDGGTVATVLGELDVASAPELKQALAQPLEGDGEVELDLRACSFVDSMGIATLVTAARRLSQDGRTLTIRGARDRVRRIFDLAGLSAHRCVVFEPDDSDAAGRDAG